MCVGDKPVKAGYEVKTGDIISIRFGDKTSRFEVLSTEERVQKSGAQDMYRVLQ